MEGFIEISDIHRFVLDQQDTSASEIDSVKRAGNLHNRQAMRYQLTQQLLIHRDLETQQ